MTDNETVETVTTEVTTAVAETAPAQTTTAQVEVKEQPKHGPARPFVPEMFDELMEKYPEQIRERTGVVALEVKLARQDAIIEYKLTPEEAVALPGKTAAEITAAAKSVSGIIAKRLEAAKSDFAKQEPEAAPFYRLPSEAEAAKETDPVKQAHNEYARIMGQ